MMRVRGRQGGEEDRNADWEEQDMRLFHHFLINAYPHLPLGSEEVWVRDVPGFAHSVSSISFVIRSNLEI